MPLQSINPRAIVLNEQRPVDEAVREAIAEEGLYDNPQAPSEIRDMIAVRREGEGDKVRYRVVKGADILRAVLDLLDKDALCYDPATGHTIRASELYQMIRVMVFDSQASS